MQISVIPVMYLYKVCSRYLVTLNITAGVPGTRYPGYSNRRKKKRSRT